MNNATMKSSAGLLISTYLFLLFITEKSGISKMQKLNVFKNFHYRNPEWMNKSVTPSLKK